MPDDPPTEPIATPPNLELRDALEELARVLSLTAESVRDALAAHADAEMRRIQAAAEAAEKTRRDRPGGAL